MSGSGVIELSRFYAHPPAAVWRVLTDPALHARWWAAGDVRPVVGHRFELDMGNFGKQPCEVLEVEPERLLKYRFAGPTLDTLITWRLVPEGDGTRLELRHEGFDLDSPMGQMAYQGMGAGWPGVLANMDAVLEPTTNRATSSGD